MTRRLTVLFAGLAALLSVGRPALGQVLQVSVTANGTTSNVSAGGAVNLTAGAIGQAVNATVTVTYNGVSAAHINGISFSGSSAIVVAGTPALPIVLSPASTASFVVQYLPTTSSSVSGVVSIAFTEGAGTPTVPVVQPQVFTFTVNGTTPTFAFTYFVLPNGAPITLASGAPIAFPPTNVGGSSSVVLNILNIGSAPGSVQSVSVNGADYQVVGGTPPVNVGVGQQTSFTLIFTPHAAVTSTGLVSVGVGNSSAVFPLSGTGTLPSLTVFYTLSDNNVQPLPDGTAINLPSVDVNGSTTVTIDIANQGTGAGTVNSISLSGTGFQLGGIPPLPLNVPGGQDLRFAIVFSPTQAGNFTGTLRITLGGTTTINATLAGSTKPSSLAVSYALADGNAHPFSSGTNINFPQIDVNTTTTANVTIVNQGTGTGSLTNISVTGTGFVLTGTPVLPTNIPAGQSVRFGILFSPTQGGSFNGTFSITLNGSTLSGTLSGSTNTPNVSVTYALADGNAHPIFNGVAIAFPSIDSTATTTATITVVNQSTGASTLNSIAVSGTGFVLTGSPVLPTTIPGGQNLHFGIVFAPTQVGSFSGSFSITLNGNTISGSLSGSTNTPTLAASYTLSDGIVHPLSNGSGITFPSVDINATTTATITIANQGTGTGTLTNISLSGAGFQVSGAPQLPATLTPNQSLHFGIVFAPTAAGSFTGTFGIALTGQSITGTLTASTATPNYSVSYVDPSTTNVLPLANSATLRFPSTPVGTAASIAVLAANTGAGSGSINSITLGSATSGAASAFQLLNLPPFPLNVPPSQQLRFGVRFSPQQSQSATDTLIVAFNGGLTITINLQGDGTQSQFTYGVGNGTGSTLLAAGGAVAMPDTTVGQTSSVTITINNFGTADGQIANIGVTGTGLTLTNVPAVPFTLHPNGSQQFTMNFAPTQPGAITGKLTIGSDIFTVTANGIGPLLTYTYTSAGSGIAVTDGGTVIFPPISVGNNENLAFSIQNTGTSAATISSINLAAASTIFSLSQLPGLPMNLSPGATIAFIVGFAPNNTGSLTATMRVNNSSFTLAGNGTQPAPLPSYQFQGPTGTQPPAQQPVIGLNLASSYPLPLQGTLTLTFVSSVFTDDPSIQFASGGRTLNFTIPANSTQALFTGNSPGMALQTGTTAGNIIIKPTFAIQGGFDLTPASPTTLSLTIPRAAPTLQSANITSETLGSFTLVLTGFSTSRSLTKFDIQITPKSGQRFTTTSLSVDASAAATAWFQSTTSQGFGGSFLVAIPFSLSNGNTTTDLVHLLQSLSITATNDAGTSSATTVQVP